MKFLTALVFLSGLAVANATAGSLPWVEDFVGATNGAVSDDGVTSWTAVRGGGRFEIKDETLWVNGGSSEGTLESGLIDVSPAKFVEIKVLIDGGGGLDSTGNYIDHVEVYAILSNGRKLLVGHRLGTDIHGTAIVGVVDVTEIPTMKLDIRAKTTSSSEHIYIHEISVISVGDYSDGCTYYDLNMDSLPEGTYVSDQFHDSHGVDLSCTCKSCSSGDCRVFDTANPVGDIDLGAPNEKCPGGGPGRGSGGEPGKPGENCYPLGHILIVDENGDSIPDDAVGGDITFTFTKPVEFLSIDQVDNEGSEHYAMEFYRDGAKVTTVNGAFTGDNGYAATPLLGDATKDIDKLKLVLSGSGSVNSVKYRICPEFTTPNKEGGGAGDPHFKRWGRKSFEFHGECDLVLLHSDHVNGDKRLDVHVRTVIHEWWSQIESAAMRIGEETLQMDVDKFFVNGKEYSDEDLPLQTSEFSIAPPVDGTEATFNLRGTGKDVLKNYVVTFNDKSIVTFKILNGFMNVEISGHREDFERSVGLMGTYDYGKPYGRAGFKMETLEAFAFDWQVDPSVDPILFNEAKGPQLPLEKCRMPGPSALARRGRRLAKTEGKLYEAAKTACAGKGDEMGPCMNDIMATNDVAMALLH